MLKKSGFPNGITTLKETVEELLAETEGKAFVDMDFEGLFE
jgi:hypothetical protein